MSRLIHSRRCSAHDHDHKHALEFSEMDDALDKIGSFRRSDAVDELRLQLRETEGNLRVVEEKVESLFKRLIKTRVSLLNMHSN